MNPCSGKKKANRVLAEIIDILNRGGYDVTAYMTAARGDATMVAAQRAAEFDVWVTVEELYRKLTGTTEVPSRSWIPKFDEVCKQVKGFDKQKHLKNVTAPDDFTEKQSPPKETKEIK